MIRVVPCASGGNVGGRPSDQENDLEKQLSNPCVSETSEALETCSICLDALSSDAITPLLSSDGAALQPASCRHYVHLRCAQRLRPRRCPVCRVAFVQLRRVTREGVLGMTGDELRAALSRLHGRVTGGTTTDFITAVFPVTAAKASERVNQLAGASAGRGRTSANLSCSTLNEDGLARVLHHFNIHSGTMSRPLSYYSGGSTLGSERFNLIIYQQARRSLLRLCGGLGGACHGFIAGVVAGTISGLTFRGPPRLTEEAKVPSPAPRPTNWIDLLGHLVDSLAPWHIFGSAVFAVAIAIAIGCVSVLLARLFVAASRAFILLWRLLHRALWFWAAASLGRDVLDEHIGSHICFFCAVSGGVIGASLGFARALIAIDPSRRRCIAKSFMSAACSCFWAGVRASCILPAGPMRWRRRRRIGRDVRANHDFFGDGSLRDED